MELYPLTEKDRTAAEVASACIIMLRWPRLRTKTMVFLWLDNCSYQNKNYTLFSTLIALALATLLC